METLFRMNVKRHFFIRIRMIRMVCIGKWISVLSNKNEIKQVVQ